MDTAPPADALTRFLAAVAGVASGLSLPTILRHVVESSTDLAGARYGALGVMGHDHRLVEFFTTGFDDHTQAAIGKEPEGKGVLGVLVTDPTPLRLADLTEHPQTSGFPPGHPPMRSFLGVPIRVGDEVFGNLYLCEKIGGDQFTEEDQVLVESLAAIAAVAVQNARMHERLQDLAVLGDRERIARDLHDKVIQRLFAAGMALQAARHLPPDDVTTRIDHAVDELDLIVNEIRSTIFDLELRPDDRPTLAAAMLATIDEMTRPVGLEAEVRFHPDVGDHVAPEIAEVTLTALREALANIARHAHARTVEVEVSCDGGVLVLVVSDDGRGIGEPSTPEAGHGHGLKNLVSRAHDWGGTCEIVPRATGGTVLTWRVPADVGTFSPPA